MLARKLYLKTFVKFIYTRMLDAVRNQLKDFTNNLFRKHFQVFSTRSAAILNEEH
jgi:hypothetical protein